jgi:hypothetical protein
MRTKIAIITAAALGAISIAIVISNSNQEEPASASDKGVESRIGRDGRPSFGGGGRKDSPSSKSDRDRIARESQARREGKTLAMQWEKRASTGFRQTRKRLIIDLGLNKEQVRQLDEVFPRREEKLAELLEDMSFGREGHDDLQKICDLLRNKGLRNDLEGILSPEQLEQFDVKQARHKQNAIEAQAYRDLAGMNAAVRLTEAQKQEVLGVFAKMAPSRIETEADARAFMSLTYGPMAIEMDSSYVRGLANLLALDPVQSLGLDFESPDFRKIMQKRNSERIENELSAVREILDEDQLARHRTHLESQLRP